MSQSIDPSAPTVVLVHGTFADSSSWNAVTPSLLDQGYPVVAVAHPLRGLKSDTDYVAAVLKSVAGPIVRVGHSYAGSVIRNAPTRVDNVVALVFVAASAPDAGESAGQLAGRFPGSTLGDKLNIVDLPNGDVDLYVQQDTVWQQILCGPPRISSQCDGSEPAAVYHRVHQRPGRRSGWKSTPVCFI